MEFTVACSSIQSFHTYLRRSQCVHCS